MENNVREEIQSIKINVKNSALSRRNYFVRTILVNSINNIR